MKTTKKQTREELESQVFNWKVNTFAFIFIIIVLVLGFSFTNNSTINSLQKENEMLKSQINQDFNSIVYFDNINKNCGSSYVTYYKDGYYIFKTTEKDGWSRYDYIPLKDCEVLK